MIHKIRLTISETKGIPHQSVPITQGVPLPKGGYCTIWIRSGSKIAMDKLVPAQFRSLGRWADGSLKWVLTDFSSRSDRDEGEVSYFFCYGQESPQISTDEAIQVEESDDCITVCTGPLRFVVNRRQFSLIESAELGCLDAEGAFVPEHKVHTQDGDSVRRSVGAYL